MIHGLDTGFLVAAEVLEHAEHMAARDTLTRLITAGDVLAIAPQVLAEFIHIITDPRRFARPLDMTAARQLAEQWWTARDIYARLSRSCCHVAVPYLAPRIRFGAQATS